jgi:hypothetical protein
LGNNPKPAITDVVTINPGESLSASIKGSWIDNMTNQKVDSLSVGIGYKYSTVSDKSRSGDYWHTSLDSPLN